MNSATRQRILSFLTDRGGVVRTADMTDAGFHHGYLSELVNDGTLTRIKSGLYILAETETVAGFYEIQLALPGSVICLASALSYYDLTTYEPAEAHVAIQRDDRTVPPDFPPVRLFSFSGARYKLGVVEEEVEGRPIRIYDREKSLCDALRFRRTLGENVAYESARNYISTPERNIERLIEYATRLGMRRSVEYMLRAYL